jgi:hypothetical protein
MRDLLKGEPQSKQHSKAAQGRCKRPSKFVLEISCFFGIDTSCRIVCLVIVHLKRRHEQEYAQQQHKADSYHKYLGVASYVLEHARMNISES